jgi:hypothetical protein
MPSHSFDLIVVGAGSGGLGAAIAGAQQGLKTLLVEKSDQLGGTAVRGGVHVWESSVGGTGIPFEIYKRLKCIPDACAINSIGRHGCWQHDARNVGFLGGEFIPHPKLRYIDSLRRHGARAPFHEDEGFFRKYLHSVSFEPDAYVAVVREMLEETRCCETLLSTHVVKVNAQDGEIESLLLSDGREVSALTYVDGTADAVLAGLAGCEMVSGQEPASRYDELTAPENATSLINGVSLIYRVQRREVAAVEPLPRGIPAECWWAPHFPWASMAVYPNGDVNINTLPTMQGKEFLSMPYAEAYKECRRRILAHWHWMQSNSPEFRQYAIHWIAPGMGVRETRRIVAEYTLTQQDLMAGIAQQTHPDIITLGDHSMDVHGEANRHHSISPELQSPYGVPFHCMIPKGWTNLLVACRGAGFSAIAASSFRLSRNMMQLGQAAATAAVIAKTLGLPVSQTPASLLRERLKAQNVELEWPRPPELIAHLQAEDSLSS